MTDATQDSKVSYWPLALLCIFSALILFSFRATDLSGMSSGFAAQLSEGEWSFHVHHLLTQPAMLVFAFLLDPFGCDYMCAGQTHGILWAVITVASTYMIILHLTRSVPTAFFGGLLVLFSHGIWVFATQLEAYGPLIGMSALVGAIVIRNGSARWSHTTMLTVTAIFTLSLFFHQANVFLLVPIAIYLWLTQGLAGVWTVVKVTVIAGVVSLSVNLLVFLSENNDFSVRNFYLWLTYYAVVSDDGHGTWSALLALDPARFAAAARSIAITVITEPSDLLQKPTRILVTSILLLAFLWNVVYVAGKRPGRDARIFIIAWAATFVIFFTWWHANVHKFFLTAVVPLLILCALAVSDLVKSLRDQPVYSRGVAMLAVLVVGMIATVNFDRSIRPLTGEASGIVWVSTKLARATPQECVLYTQWRFTSHLRRDHGMRQPENYRAYQMMYMKYHFGRFNPDIDHVLPQETDVNVDDCNVILLAWLDYEDFQYKDGKGLRRATVGTDEGIDGPNPNWPEFIAWILDVRSEPDGSGIVHDEFEIFRGEDNEAWVRINRNRSVRADSLNALLDAIEELVNNDPSIEFTREEHDRLYRFRKRVFGYN